MSKHGLSQAQLKAKKTRAFFDKVQPWLNKVPREDRQAAYYHLLIFASEQIPLVHQAEVLEKAQNLHYELQQGRG